MSLPSSHNAEDYSVLVVDSDSEFLRHASEAIAADGHRAWGAPDLFAAMNLLASQTPDILVAELALLESDGADPLRDLLDSAPGAPVILTTPGTPSDTPTTLSRADEVFGYHNKETGAEGLRRWVNLALRTTRQRRPSGPEKG